MKNKMRQLFLEHNKGLYRVIRNIVKDHSLTEEILQDVFLQAFESYPTIKNKDCIGPWLYKVAANKAFSVIKRERFFDKVPLGILELNKYSVEEDFLEALSSEELKNHLRSNLYLLDTLSYTILILFYYEEMKINQISEILEIPSGTVKSRMHRAKTKLKKHMANFYRDTEEAVVEWKTNLKDACVKPSGKK